MQKSCKKLHSKPPQTQPGPLPNLPKSRPGASMRAKMRPRVPHERPRGTPEAPKRRPRAPKRRPRTPKRRPRDAREAPRPLQNRAGHAPRCILGTFFAGTSVRKAPGSIFDRFLRRTWTGRHVFRMVFSIRNACRTLSALQARVHEKTSKNTWLDPPKPSPDPPQTLQNRAPGAPGRPKNSQDEPKPVKKRPRSAQERKTAPTNEK